MKKMRLCPMAFAGTIVVDLLLIFLIIIGILSKDEFFWLWFCIIATIPLIINIYILPFSMDIVILNNKGIVHYHFKKIKKEIDWEKVHTVFRYDRWITISEFENITTNFWTLNFRFYDKRVICIPYSEDIDDFIYAHCGLRAQNLKKTKRLF